MAFGDLKGTLAGNGNSIAASNDLVGSVSIAVGDLVFVAFGEQGNLSATTTTDNLGNTYVATNAGTDSGTATGRAYYSRVTIAGTLTTVTVNAGAGSDDWSAIAAVIEGPFSPVPLDANPSNISNDLTSPFTCPPTGTLAQAEEAILAWITSDGNAIWSATSPNLKAGQIANFINIKAIIGYQAVNSTSSVSPEFTGTVPFSSILGTSSFKEALAAGVRSMLAFWLGGAAVVVSTPTSRGGSWLVLSRRRFRR